jgi:biopolymer transport protein TolQ
VTLALLSAATAAATAPARLNPVDLFLQADIVVQAVMAGLILASVWVWTIIISFSLRIGKMRKASRSYEATFWDQQQRDSLLTRQAKKDIPSARIAAAGLDEWKKSTTRQPVDRDAARQRIAAAMDSQIAEEAESLAGRLNFLATVGSVGPFVGLFGTVWGIMNSFFQIGAQQSASLAVVAPGIAEALFATAIGLFAAIPAVIAYNRFGAAVDRYEFTLQRFADKLHMGLSRELDRA